MAAHPQDPHENETELVAEDLIEEVSIDGMCGVYLIVVDLDRLPDALLDEPWVLSPSVALRPEPFGALAYHFGNRKLTFLKRPELVAVVRALGDQPDVRTALCASGVPEAQHPAYAAALRELAAADMIRRRLSNVVAA